LSSTWGRADQQAPGTQIESGAFCFARETVTLARDRRLGFSPLHRRIVAAVIPSHTRQKMVQATRDGEISKQATHTVISFLLPIIEKPANIPATTATPRHKLLLRRGANISDLRDSYLPRLPTHVSMVVDLSARSFVVALEP